MTTINLRDYYYWYTEDEFVDVTDEVAAELAAGSKYEKHHEQRMRRNKSVYSLDVGDGIETAAVLHPTDDPVAIIEMAERHCGLCRALNSLPDKQGRRIEAYYILGKSQRDIAREEGVNERSVRRSISMGLSAMKEFLKKYN